MLDALLGKADSATDFVINTLRLPRLLTGLSVGAALGLSGAILQSLSRNLLASPDIIGFTNGAGTGAIMVVVLVHGSMTQISAGAVLGGVLTSLAVYLLAFRRGVAGYRLILVGIGISAIMLSINSYLITRASFADAITAQIWLIGGLNGRTWSQAVPVLITLAVLLPLALLAQRRLTMLDMGDDAVAALGVNVEHTRLELLLISVGLAATATAMAGPIAFVALAAPQLARRLTRTTGPGLLPAGLMGALLLSASDLAVQRLFAPTLLPVGIATGALGGLYLMWLLGHEWRRGRL
ncbi:MAG: FecCD family ABC transporter permease [Sciscionella sp.]